MPFALVIIGLIMIITGARNTNAALGKQLVSDFTGTGNFTYWIAALGAVGALGYVNDFRAFSRAFMSLIIIVMILSNQGFFAKLSAALKAGPTAQTAPATPTPNDAAGTTVGILTSDNPLAAASQALNSAIGAATTNVRNTTTGATVGQTQSNAAGNFKAVADVALAIFGAL